MGSTQVGVTYTSTIFSVAGRSRLITLWTKCDKERERGTNKEIGSGFGSVGRADADVRCLNPVIGNFY